MYNVFALLIAGVVLAAASSAFAGEPTGRYQGAEGQAPQGVDQPAAVQAPRGGYVTAAASGQIVAGRPLGESEVALRTVGRGLVATATMPGSVEDQIRLASRQ